MESKTAKLADHRLTNSLTSLADADLHLSDDENFILLASSEGSIEAYSFSKAGFCFITRLKLDGNGKWNIFHP